MAAYNIFTLLLAQVLYSYCSSVDQYIISLNIFKMYESKELHYTV